MTIRARDHVIARSHAAWSAALWAAAGAAWGVWYALIDQPATEPLGLVKVAIGFGLVTAAAAAGVSAWIAKLGRRYRWLAGARDLPAAAWAWGVSWAALGALFAWLTGLEGADPASAAAMIGPMGAVAGSTYTIDRSRRSARGLSGPLDGPRLAQLGAIHGTLVIVLLFIGLAMSGGVVWPMLHETEAWGRQLLGMFQLFGLFGGVSALVAVAGRRVIRR